MVIIREICMWLNGYVTLSAVVIVRRCPHQPLASSAATVVVRRFPRPSVCKKSAPPHFTRYIHRFPPQHLSAIYPLQYPHIRILPLPSLFTHILVIIVQSFSVASVSHLPYIFYYVQIRRRSWLGLTRSTH